MKHTNTTILSYIFNLILGLAFVVLLFVSTCRRLDEQREYQKTPARVVVPMDQCEIRCSDSTSTTYYVRGVDEK